MKSTIWKRLGSILMVLIMVFTIIPDIGVTVRAQPRENETAQGQDNTYPISVTTAEGYAYASIKNEDGTTERINRAAPGEKIYLEFSDVNTTPRTGFVRWVDDNGNLTDLTNETSYDDCSFTMPEGEAKIHAELAQNCPTVTVENGGIKVRSEERDYYYRVLSSPSVTAGREIYLAFDESKTPKNKVFKKWYVKSGNVELNNPTSKHHCMITVPNEDVEIGVIYDEENIEGTYPISVTATEGHPRAVVKNEDGTIKQVKRAAPGEKIHLEFSDYDMASGTGFARWVDDNGNLTDLTNETSYYGCSFTMPEGEVKIHAELAQNCPTVTVENGRIMVHSEEGDFYILNSSSVTAGREIYLDFDESKTPENKIFKKWYVKSGNVELSDPTSMSHCMLTVPNEDVEIGVIYESTEGTYPISVTAEEGYSYAEVINEDGKRKRVNRAAPGEKIYLQFSDYKMTSRTGFARWVDDNGNLTDLTNETSYYDCSFTMPEGEVKIHAELAQNCPTVTVENGGIKVRTGERDFYVLNSSSVTAGREIYLNFDESKTPENKVFKKWYVKSGNVELSDPTSEHQCMFTVPNEDVEIGVIYESTEGTYPISVTTEEGYSYAEVINEDGTRKRVNRAAPGEKIYLYFSDYNMTSRTGFVRWVDDNGNLTDLTNETSYYDCSFTMPEGEVKIHAELAQNCPTVTVENGGIKVQAGERKFYILNSSSVTAGREIYLNFDESKTPENKVFKKWYVKSGNVELSDPTSEHQCMFTVPNEDVEIGVIYESTEGTYPISVTTADGYSYAEVINEDGTRKRVNRAAPGEKIYLHFSDYNMTSRTGFVRWVDDNGNLTDLTNETSYFYDCSFTMPEGEVKIHAELAQNCPTVTVENGRIMVQGEDADFHMLSSSSVTAGREIYLYFDKSKTPKNKVFKKWYVKSGNVELSDPTSMYGCTLTVPSEDVEIGVIYDDTEDTYPISVTTEEGYSYAEVINEDGTRKRVNRAAPGEKIYLCFSDYNMTSRTGFARWVDDNGNLTDLTNETSYYDCSFTMPEGEVKIHAELAQNCPTVTVENGGIKVQAGERKFYILNSSSVTAGREIYLNFDESKTPENKVFKKWYVKSGNVELSDPTSKHHCMLTVPNEDVEIGVIYEAEAGWQSDNVGWWYNDENGNYVTGWKYIDSKWYYFASNGYMQTGWVSVNNHWYYMDQWGAMCNGWVAVDGHWYYMDQWGAMCTGWVSVNGYWYYMDQWGAMQTGWVSVNGYWYYMDQWGAMQTGWVSVNGYWYYMDQWGAMQTGWVSVNGHWYYMDQWGAMQTGWVLVGSDWYYMNTDGSMATSQWIDGYYVDASGKME